MLGQYARTSGLSRTTKQADMPQDTASHKKGDVLIRGGLHCNASLVMDVTITHPFIGNSHDTSHWGKYQPSVLVARERAKQIKHWYHTALSISFIPFVVTTHGLLGAESLRLCHQLAQLVTRRVFDARGWDHVGEDVFKAHAARHFTRYRGLVLMTALKGGAARTQAGTPWHKPANRWDQELPMDPGMDVPVYPRGDSGFG